MTVGGRAPNSAPATVRSLAIFGLTGGIASGKSTVAGMLRDLGALVMDADALGHELMARGQPAYEEILQAFGEGILDIRGEIDRRRLGSIVFADDEKRRQLNAILHPRILTRQEEMAAAWRRKHPAAVIAAEAALIYEAGVASRFAKVIVTWCRPEQQVERLVAKAGLSREEAQRRVDAQWPAEEKRRRADYVIDCSGSLAATRAQVEQLFPKLQHITQQAVSEISDGGPESGKGAGP